jgi:phosphoglycolate phosphatase
MILSKKVIILILSLSILVGSGSYLCFQYWQKKNQELFSKKLVLFDFDGTLFDTIDELIVAVNQTLKEYGYPAEITRQEVQSSALKTCLKKRGIPFWRIPFLQKRALAIMTAAREKTQPFEDTKEYLLALKNQGYAVGILTSNSKENVMYLLNKYGFNFFDIIYCGASIFGKARSFKACLYEHNVPYNQVLYVGDEVRDIEAAHTIGIPIIAVSWGCNDEKLLKDENPEYLISHQTELLSIVQAHFNSIRT